MKRAIFPALLTCFSFALLVNPTPGFSTSVWDIFDHPAGNQNPPPYGLRLDGLEHFYQTRILNGTAPSDVTDRDVWTFSFGEPGTSNSTLTHDDGGTLLDDSDDTVTIEGTLFGGRDGGGTGDTGNVRLSYVYNTVGVGVVNGETSFSLAGGVGTLTFLDQIESILGGGVDAAIFDLVSFGGAGQYTVNGHRLGGSGCSTGTFDPNLERDELCRRHVGNGWHALVDPDDQSQFHVSSQDFLYTGSPAPIPVPPALPLFLGALVGLGGLGFMKRRRKAVA